MQKEKTKTTNKLQWDINNKFFFIALVVMFFCSYYSFMIIVQSIDKLILLPISIHLLGIVGIIPLGLIYAIVVVYLFTQTHKKQTFLVEQKSLVTILALAGLEVVALVVTQIFLVFQGEEASMATIVPFISFSICLSTLFIFENDKTNKKTGEEEKEKNAAESTTEENSVDEKTAEEMIETEVVPKNNRKLKKGWTAVWVLASLNTFFILATVVYLFVIFACLL